jgi:bifunctional DNA-binding transcriptional regulator/antitoxin component of YhaV-PrlF toxin-antitoxin module
MTRNGKSELLFKEPKIAWTTKTSMEKLRQHLGLEATVSGRHQITIPRRLVQEFDIHPGDKIRFEWISESGGRQKVLAIISREGRRLAVLRILVRLISKRRS